MLETLQHIDRELLLTLNGLHTPFWDTFMWEVSKVLTWVPMYATLLYILVRNFNWRIAVLGTVAFALVVVFADQVCASLIRPCVERMRPSNPDNPISEFVHIVNGKRGGRYGFPSCHAANSFALAFFAMFLFKQRWLTLFLLGWATLNSYSRVYLGVHYPGDLLAGMLVGLCGAALIHYAVRCALRQPAIAKFLKYEGRDACLLRTPALVRYASSTIYVGSATLLLIAGYAGIKLLCA